MVNFSVIFPASKCQSLKSFTKAHKKINFRESVGQKAPDLTRQTHGSDNFILRNTLFNGFRMVPRIAKLEGLRSHINRIASTAGELLCI